MHEEQDVVWTSIRQIIAWVVIKTSLEFLHALHIRIALAPMAYGAPRCERHVI